MHAMITSAADMKAAIRRGRFAGVILYRGPSMLDGAPVVVIANRITESSNNAKTGAMIQTFIIRADVNPITALKDGRDESICGDCPQRPFRARNYIGPESERPSGKCYVDVAKSVLSVFGAYGRGRYAVPGVDYCPSIIPELFADSAFRCGTYGDPTAAPFQIWRAATLRAKEITGYSHQWRRPDFQAFASICMASCESESDQLLASACGWRTFRAKQPEHPKAKSEIGCPAAKENGARTNCASCGLCAGNSSKSPRDIVINLHGFRVGNRRAKKQAAPVA
jgi:hypothetical protein